MQVQCQTEKPARHTIEVSRANNALIKKMRLMPQSIFEKGLNIVLAEYRKRLEDERAVRENANEAVANLQT